MPANPADGADHEALQRRIAALEAELAAAKAAKAASDAIPGALGVQVDGNNSGSVNTGTQTSSTEGGALIGRDVIVRGGHFIGRDFIQSITHITHQGEDPAESQSVIAHYLHALIADLAGLRLGEIDASADPTPDEVGAGPAGQKRRTPLELADIYVPLDTTLRIPEVMTLADWLAHAQDTLMAELATIVRNTCRAPSNGSAAPTFEITTIPNPRQRHALALIENSAL